jgi:hypothetical protein
MNEHLEAIANEFVLKDVVGVLSQEDLPENSSYTLVLSSG